MFKTSRWAKLFLAATIFNNSSSLAIVLKAAPVAGIGAHQIAAIDKFVRTYNKSKDVQDLNRRLASYQNDDEKRLYAEVTQATGAIKPTLSRQGPLKIILAYEGKYLTIGAVEGDPGKLVVNNKILDLGRVGSAEQRFRLIIEALPSEHSAANDWIPSLLPRANALPLKLLKEASLVALALGAVTGMYGMMQQKDAICGGWKDALTACRKVVGAMRKRGKWLDKIAKHEEAVKAAAEKGKKAKPKAEPKKKKAKGDEDEDEDPLNYDVTEEEGYIELQNDYIEAVGNIENAFNQTTFTLGEHFCATSLDDIKACSETVVAYAAKLQMDDGKPIKIEPTSPPSSQPAAAGK